MADDGPVNGDRYLHRPWAEEHQRQHVTEWADHRRHDVDPLLQAVRGEIHAETAERRLLEGRVNGVESSFDQLRGARALIYFLIGSNLLAVLAVLVGIMR